MLAYSVIRYSVIGPFVIEPAVSRKIGKTALSELTLAAHEWKSAAWANQKGLYAKVFETPEELYINNKKTLSLNELQRSDIKKVASNYYFAPTALKNTHKLQLLIFCHAVALLKF